MLKKAIGLFIITLCVNAQLKAAPGDTTKVRAHDKVDMTWNGKYNAFGNFPDGTKSYNKIWLHYTMGCATGGCSDWDYTTRIEILNPTGVYDSTVNSIDTISTNPLVIDTIWDVFEVKEAFELGRVITPYGGDLPNDWTHTYVFDVTDYYPMLKNNVEIQATYSGYSSGFSVTTDFIFIEGTPERKVISIDNIYNKYFNYITSAEVESTHLTPKTVNIHPNTQSASLRIVPTGHGFVNAINCAEFCKKDYYVKVNQQKIATQAMWRDDCGLNPIWPQAGTWLYDRANWCPGSEAIIYNHDISNQIQAGSTAEIDVDLEVYNYTVPSGETPAGYFFSTQLIQYEANAFVTDAEISTIIAPSNTDAYGRFNPICGKVIFKIKNNGTSPLTSADIVYGMRDGQKNTYAWTGNLAYGEEETVELSTPGIHDWVTYSGKMVYVVDLKNPNQTADDFPYNNSKTVSFEPTPRFPSYIRMILRTNNAAHQTYWTLKDANGNLIASGDNLSNNTSYIDTFDLADGCYHLHIGDRAKNGLTFFANNEGSGSIVLRNIGGDYFSVPINPNFGTEANVYFTVGYSVEIYENKHPQSQLDLFPNPAKDVVSLTIEDEEASPVMVTLIDTKGQTVQMFNFNKEAGLFKTDLPLYHISKGMYMVKVETQSGSSFKKLVLE